VATGGRFRAIKSAPASRFNWSYPSDVSKKIHCRGRTSMESFWVHPAA
jgi:hypothetical protein